MMAILVTHRRQNLPYSDDYDLDTQRTPPPQKQQQQQQQHKPPGPAGGIAGGVKKPLPGSGVSSGSPSPQDAATDTPNTSGLYDTLIVIPSSWTQMQNRRWVRETVFGIQNNLEPCKKHDGRILYKFYIHGRSTWLKSGIHSAEFNQAQVRDLYAEFMEYDDYYFSNTTVAYRHTIWDEALNWAVNTFIPDEKIKVNNVLIFDSTTIVNVPEIEKAARKEAAAGAVNGGASSEMLYTWSEPDSATSTNNKAFAAMISYATLRTILNKGTAIKQLHVNSTLVEGAALYYTRKDSPFKVIRGNAQLWTSDIDQVHPTSIVVGQVYQQEDWQPIAHKLTIAPVAACAIDKARKNNVAVLTSSYVYVDMCMAEASLPSAENKRSYAKKHGYDYVARSAEFAQEEFRGRRLVWGKIGAIQKVLPHYEWLLWMDMDAIVANPEKDVRDIIRMAENAAEREYDEVSLIVSRPRKDKMLNAGVMLIKNSDWSRRFFSEVQRRKNWYHKRPSYEQGAIWEVMQEEKWASGVHLFDRDDHTMNSFPAYYETGDFVIHFAPAGCPAVPVLEALDKIKKGESALGIGL
ncbi:hypothetical protein BG004_001750 [Podila humilis]|nr:hypothetical protein BG004_001750 [Podila humilis]